MPIPTTPDASHRRSALLPWLVLVVAAGLVVAAWWLVTREVKRTALARFEQLTERIQGTVRQRFESTAQLLHGAAAFPDGRNEVTAADWSAYLRQVSAHLGNGAVGLGYVERVPRDAVAALEARMQALGETGFKVERGSPHDWLDVVVAIEPRERNTGVLGLDVGSGKTRRSAAEDAAARNELILSRRIRLNYDGREVPGFLLFLPVYRKGAAIDTREQRLAVVQGWVYAPIRVDRLMAGVAESVAGQIDFEVYEGDGTGADALLFDSDGDLAGRSGPPAGQDDSRHRSAQRVQTLEVYGRRWSVQMSTRPEFDEAGFSYLPTAVLVVGLVFSGLATLLTWVLVTARQRALKLARGMTADLRRLALLAGRTSNGVLLADPEWRVEWINDGFTRLFGFTLEEIKGRPPDAFLTGPETDAKEQAAMARAAELRQPYLGEILQYTKDGRKVWIELEIQPLLDEEGRLEGFMELQLDITERRRHAEDMREAAESAEKASQAKSEFLAVMSHEFLTPMNGVIGMSSLLLDTPLTAEQRESAETIRQSGAALLAILNDILDYTKIESGQLALEQTEFMLGECCEGALDQAAGPAAQKKIDLHYEFAADAPAMVLGDPARLRHVLVNLLGNAVKFTERGEVLLSVRVAARQAAAVDLLIQVRDTGIGIPPEGRTRLFKPFSQVDASLTRSHGGIGLGLAICRRLVELMGGSIALESAPGRGSTFSIALRLPVVAGDPVAPPAAARSLHGRRILVLADRATGRRILVELVRRRGLLPVVAESADLAFVQLQLAEKFDAAIIDLKQSVTDNRDLVARLRELPGRAALPFIVCSEPEWRETGMGGNAVLARPVKPAPLLAALEEIFWPRTKPPVVARPVKPAPPPTAESTPLRILVAEGDPAERKATADLISLLGYQTEVAADGAELLAALELRSFDVVFLDLFMPVMDGLEAARQVRRDLPKDAQPWLVALTGAARPGERETCRAAGVDDCLSKPLVRAELAAALVRARLRLPS